MDTKEVLIVYAHQEPRSFVGALKDIAVETLEGQGHKVTISDLYEMRFDPVASKHAFTDGPPKPYSTKQHLQNKDRFSFQQELSSAAQSGSLPEDVRLEIDKILTADLIIMQFPMYWLSLPAVLKGWMDRCFVEKVCFDTVSSEWFDNGPFVNKKILLCLTTGGSRGYFSNKGLFGDMDVLLWPVHNSLRFTGFQVLVPHICYAPGDVTMHERTCMLQSWKDRLQQIWTEDPLKFIHIKHFNEKNEFQLTDDYLENSLDRDPSPNAGQNLGRAFQSGCMTGETNVQSDQ